MFVFPGQVIESDKKPGNGVLSLGGNNYIATKAGTVQEQKKSIQVLNSQKRYIPKLGDFVIGKVVAKNQEQYRVDIGSAFSANLDALSFEGATKRNRPNLNIGSIVYCQVSLADKDLEPEVVCINGSGKADGMGELLDGYVITCTLNFGASLADANNQILKSVGEITPFEVVAGWNGRVWIKTTTVKSQILLINLLCSADGISSDQLPSLLSHYMQKFKDIN
jgi:exosome complex component RRP40